MHTWNDGHGDTQASAVLHKLEKTVHIVKELRDDHLSTRLNLQMFTQSWRCADIPGQRREMSCSTACSLIPSHIWQAA